MNRDEIIKKLENLPSELPIVFYRYNDRKTPIGSPIQKINIVKAYKSFRGTYQKYDSLCDLNKKDELVDVIWIE